MSTKKGCIITFKKEQKSIRDNLRKASELYELLANLRASNVSDFPDLLPKEIETFKIISKNTVSVFSSLKRTLVLKEAVELPTYDSQCFKFIALLIIESKNKNPPYYIQWVMFPTQVLGFLFPSKSLVYVTSRKSLKEKLPALLKKRKREGNEYMAIYERLLQKKESAAALQVRDSEEPLNEFLEEGVWAKTKQ